MDVPLPINTAVTLDSKGTKAVVVVTFPLTELVTIATPVVIDKVVQNLSEQTVVGKILVDAIFSLVVIVVIIDLVNAEECE